MLKIGYALSSEEHAPNRLVDYARHAEEIGFSFALISDHYHPWLKRQGQSPFVWSVIGAIAQATQRFALGTGVTCPTIRTHPAIIAQAAATAAAMMPGRFFLGLGTGENLNEHILGTRWPPMPVRREMLLEAIEILRLLWQGGSRSHRGKYYTVEAAEIFTLPEKPPPIYLAAAGKKSAELAGGSADGLISVMPEAELVKTFRAAGGAGKPCYGQTVVCWGETEEEAGRIAREWWPVAALPGALMSELATPAMFEQAASLVGDEALGKSIVLGPDPAPHIAEIDKFRAAGFDHVYVHQVGPNQEGFFRFYEREILPKVS
jgi:coenzyme F420-dependent glucose-6-phosphate dehydrogenase